VSCHGFGILNDGRTEEAHGQVGIIVMVAVFGILDWDYGDGTGSTGLRLG
jgi:hypothetical protein